ncbi:NrtA/SsuA/CpmA family ABC transporter substrate-binding protein [Vibrio profundum]|uniref:ABC transporter substrate-binding protein n=1 Tax=Vibrio profundum TaxID=2910247 RepID=UPI003D0F5252
MSVGKWLGLAALLSVLVVGYNVIRTKAPTPIGNIVIAEASQPVFSLLYIAKEKGFFKQQGLNVTFRSFTSGRDALQDTVDGNSDLATSYETPVVLQTLAGADLKVISSLHFSNKNTAMLALKSAGILNPQDLIGKTVAVPKNTNADFFLNMYLASEGIPFDAVNTLDVKPEHMLSVLEQKKADAVAIWNPHLYILNQTLGAESTSYFYSNAYTEFSVLVGQSKVIEEKSVQMAAIAKALIKAEHYLGSSPQQAKELVVNYLGDHSRSSVEGTWEDYQKTIKLNNVLVTILEQEAEWIIKQRKLTQEQPDFRSVIEPRFIKSTSPNAVTLL